MITSWRASASPCPSISSPTCKSSPKPATVEEALELYRQHLPDVVIMDYALPDKTGPEIVTAIRTEFPGARVLLLSAHEGEEHIHRAIEAGVCGYLTKNSDCALVLDSIRSIATGHSAFPPAIAAKAAARRLRPEPHRARAGDSQPPRARQHQQAHRRRARLQREPHQTRTRPHLRQTRCQRPRPRRHARHRARTGEHTLSSFHCQIRSSTWRKVMLSYAARRSPPL